MNPDGYKDWQEALLRLPSRTFFDLMRLYLGEIKTPFNKQRLLESLSGFLSKADTQHIVVKSLDRLDVLILTALCTLPITTRNALRLFFSSELSLQRRLINLEERLLIYRSSYQDEDGLPVKNYRINPLLYKALEPLLDSKLLFLAQGTGELQTEATVCDDIALAGLYSFFLKENSALKTNGTFKAKVEKQLKVIFQDNASDITCIQTLCTGLQNLGLLLKNEASLIPQQERWDEFFKQSPFDRKMYIAAAVCGHTRRDIMQMRAQFFTDFLTSLDSHRLYDDEALKRRFHFLLQKHQSKNNGEIFISPDTATTEDTLNVLNHLKILRFLLPAGEYRQINTAVFIRETIEQPFIAAPSFEITILPHTSFTHILPALSCMEPLSILTAGRFEITRAACSRCFERGGSSETLITLLDTASGGTLPQNIKANITEWYLQCTAVGLYHGFVLAVAEDKRKLFRQNAKLQKLIYKELADGVYLIRQMPPETIRTIIKSAGMDVTFYNTAIPCYTAAGFIPVEYRPSTCAFFHAAPDETPIKQDASYREHIQKLEAAVDSMPIDHDGKQNLKDKIAKKLIITEEQLYGMPLDNEVREVTGFDFLGKIHLAETVIAERNMLEVAVEEAAGLRIITGIPLTIEKTAHDAVLHIQGNKIAEKISIARIVKMRAFRDSLFS